MPKVDLVSKMDTPGDLLVVNAARVSFNKHKEEMDSSDVKLINYLARNKHISPFFHPQVIFRVQAPFFVAAQLKRHQVGASINEVSRRYVSDKITWDPIVWRVAPANKKQGSGLEYGPELQAQLNILASESINASVAIYEKLIDLKVAPEQARALLPQAVDTKWYWTGSLYFFFNLCRQRLADDAQKETREVAILISEHMEVLFPVCWTALRKFSPK